MRLKDMKVSKKDAPDFLPLEGGHGRKSRSRNSRKLELLCCILGEYHMVFTRRKWKTGKSKHYGFIEFEDSEVAEVVAECMHSYLLFEHLLQVHLVPSEQVHSKLWKGFNLRFKPLDWLQAEKKGQNKDRTLDEHNKLVEKIMKRDQKQRKRIEAVGIEYECPQIVCDIQPAPKRIKFAED